MKKKIAHIITSLGRGGAETMLFKLITAPNSSNFDIFIISLTDDVYYKNIICEKGVKVSIVNLKKHKISGIIEVLKICRKFDIIQTWMYHADFIGLLIKIIWPQKIVVWGIRHGNLSLTKNKISTLVLAKINAIFSKLIDAIIVCSNASILSHKKFGYNTSKMRLIPNGFDTDMYSRVISDNKYLLKYLNNNNDYNEIRILLCVGRWDVQKDQPNLIKALSYINRSNKFVLFMCGEGLSHSNKKLIKLIKYYDLESRIVLLGHRDDINLIMSSSDIFINPSLGEGFPNVVGEAMASECYCIVTNVGDSKLIVEPFGSVVEPNNPKELANKIQTALQMDKDELKYIGKKARQRVIQNYSLESIVSQYNTLYMELLYPV